MSKKAPYNLGDEYEEKIVNLMSKKGLLPRGFSRAGAGGGLDAKFVHQKKEYNLEIKKDLLADYGQKMVKWNLSNGWFWCVDDEVTRFYSSLGILDFLNSKNLKPNRYLKEKGEITLVDKREDQKAFEDRSLTVDAKTLHDFYRLKKIHYIQVGGGYGFYCLDEDIAGLKVPQFNAKYTLRLRAKTIHSAPTWHYGFYAVLKVLEKPKKSGYNLEAEFNQDFPPIDPK